MGDLLSPIIEDLVARVSGPMKFRLALQPVMAVFYAVRSGLKDAKEGRPPYFGPSLPIRRIGGTCCTTAGNRPARSSCWRSSWMPSTS